eukprot:6212432-Pleurochrysis_carterae.AAC.2
MRMKQGGVFYESNDDDGEETEMDDAWQESSGFEWKLKGEMAAKQGLHKQQKCSTGFLSQQRLAPWISLLIVAIAMTAVLLSISVVIMPYVISDQAAVAFVALHFPSLFAITARKAGEMPVSLQAGLQSQVVTDSSTVTTPSFSASSFTNIELFAKNSSAFTSSNTNLKHEGKPKAQPALLPASLRFPPARSAQPPPAAPPAAAPPAALPPVAPPAVAPTAIAPPPSAPPPAALPPVAPTAVAPPPVAPPSAAPPVIHPQRSLKRSELLSSLKCRRLLEDPESKMRQMWMQRDVTPRSSEEPCWKENAPFWHTEKYFVDALDAQACKRNWDDRQVQK